MLIDTHCHLEKKDYKDLEKVIDDIFNTDISKIIISGYDVISNNEALDLADKYDNVYVSIGYHPSSVDEITEKEYELLEKQLSHKKVVAIGEIGLDYYWVKDNKEKQILMFKRQLDLADKYGKTIIVHNREATSDIYDILKSKKIKGILHCYNDSLVMAYKFIDIGLFLGIGGIATFKQNSQIKEVIKDIPLEYIMLETDSPYLTPEPFRGKQNNPKYISYIAKEIAKIKGVTYDEVAHQTTSNAKGLFDF